MLSLADDRWPTLKAGYRVPMDVRPLLQQLESGGDRQASWRQLWDELHHQGDVGEASFAAVPHLVRIYQELRVVDWNAYAMVATIELARGKGGNPDVPAWLREGYERALEALARRGLADLPRAQDQETVRSILSVLAVRAVSTSVRQLESAFTVATVRC
jgi:hypothetical protein